MKSQINQKTCEKKSSRNRSIRRSFLISRSRLAALIVGIAAVGIVTIVAFGLVPANGGMASGPITVVDNSPGDQSEPSVDNDLAAYTDVNSGRIRYFDFFTSTSTPIPGAPTDIDTLSNVNGTRISFSRQRPGPPISRACMVFNVASSALVEIAPGSGVSAWQTALGGDTVAFVDAVLGQSDIKIGKVSDPTAPLASVGVPGGQNLAPAVSPDGSAVVWESCPTSSCGIMKSTFSGGSWSVAAIVSDTSSQESSPDTDGVHIVYDSTRPGSVGGQDIYFQPLAGGPETQIELAGEQRDPNISQGVIAFQTTVPGFASDLFVYVINTNTVWQVTDTPTVNDYLSDIDVLPNGDIRVIWQADDDIGFANNIYARTLPRSLAATEKIVFVTERSGAASQEIYSMNPDGSDQRNLFNPPILGSDPEISPDGSKIVYSDDDIWIVNSDGSNPVNLTNNPATLDRMPSFSPDGNQIVFASADINGISWDIWKLDVDGSNPPTNLTNDPQALESDPVFSPNGSKIAFTKYSNQVGDIWLMDADGSNPSNLTNSIFGDASPAFSPDGSRIAYTSFNSGNYDVWVMNADGSGTPTNLSNHPALSDGNPVFSPDGSKIAFISNRDGNDEVYAMNSTTGSGQTNLTQNSGSDRMPAWGFVRLTSDSDGDGVPDTTDNCPSTPNPNQADTDGDTQGDACDTDDDNDGQSDADEIACGSDPLNPASLAADNDADHSPDCVDPDDDNDGVFDTTDNCQFTGNSTQLNTDGDALGNACDPDDDNDGVADSSDNCPLNANANQADGDADGVGDVCDSCPTTPSRQKIAFVSTRDGGNYEIYTMNPDGSNQTRLTNNTGYDLSPSFSRDGSRIIYYFDNDIWVMNADGSNKTLVNNHPASDYQPAFSPDGSRIVFTSNRDGTNGDIYVMNADGTNVIRLTNNSAWNHDPSFNHDGSKIVFISHPVGGNSEIYVMDADGSNQVNLSTHPDYDIDPEWSPDGSKIVFRSDRDGFSEVFVMNSDGSNQTRLTTAMYSGQPAYSPDGNKIVFGSVRDGNTEIYVINADGSGATRLTDHPAGDTEPTWGGSSCLTNTGTDRDGDGVPDATDNCPLAPNPDQADGDSDGVGNVCDNCPSNANPERIAFVSDRSGDDEVYLMDPNGSNVLRLTTNTGFVFNPTISPNGARVAFTNLANGNYEIYSLYSYAPGGGLTNPLINLTNNAAVDDHPVYSPDGSKIAFRSTRDNDSEIYMMNADGTAPTRLTTSVGSDMQPSFSPDGSKIVFMSYRHGNWEIYKMNPDGSNQTRLTNTLSWDEQPTFSPDGSKIAFISNRDGNYEVYVMDADGSNQTRLTNDPGEDTYPSFSPNGSKLMFSTKRNGVSYDLYVMNADGSGQSPVVSGADWDFDSFWGRQPDLDRDSLGDACDPDTDGDGQSNVHEVLCGSNPIDPASRAPDNDGDNVPDCVDLDDDNDGVLDFVDNCDFTANPDQTNTDGDGLGNACDPDDDNDGVSDGADNCPLNANSSQTDTDNDGQGDACDADDDNDGVLDGVDNCPLAANTNQLNTDGDALGNVCDPDDDNDGVLDGADNCPLTPNPNQTDSDGDGAGDACDTPPGVFPIVFSRLDGGFRIFKINSDGTGLTRLTTGTIDLDPAISPDGTKIAFQRAIGEIYRMNSSGGNVVRVTNDLYYDVSPDWSPNSARLVFSSYRYTGFGPNGVIGSAELIEMDAALTTSQVQWTTDNFQDLYPAWSPDGSKIAFSSNRFGSNYEIVIFDRNTQTFQRLTNNSAMDTNPTWSPDGTKIAWATNRNGNYEIYWTNANGTSTQIRLTNDPAADTEPWWGPDGRIVFTSTRNQNTQQIHIMNANGSGVARVTNGSASFNPHW